MVDSAPAADQHLEQEDSECSDEQFHDCKTEEVVTVQQSLEDSLKSKEEATQHFKNKEFVESLNKFSLALQQAPESETQHKAQLNFNMGLCLKMSTPKEETQKDKLQSEFEFGKSFSKEMPQNLKLACEHFTKAIELDEKYMKAYFQRMQLYKDNTDYEDAISDCKKVIELEPGKLGMEKELVQLQKLNEEKMEKMKTEVIGGLKNLGNMFLKPFGVDLNNFQMQQNPDGTYNVQYKN